MTADSFLWQLHVLKFMLCSPGRAKYSDRDDGEVMVDKVPRVYVGWSVRANVCSYETVFQLDTHRLFVK